MREQKLREQKLREQINLTITLQVLCCYNCSAVLIKQLQNALVHYLIWICVF